MSDGDEETVQVIVNVPKTVRDTAKDKLAHGEMSQELRDTLTRIAFGEELGQRSRLEKRLEDLRDRRDELRRERREIDAKIENLDSRIDGVEKKIGQLTSEEERYEAKLESLEYQLRNPDQPWFHLVPSLNVVKNIAAEYGREPEGVIEDVMARNPDIPDYAFEPVPPQEDRDPIHNPTWGGVPEEDIDLDVDDREARYR